ncbi:HAD family hydrolase [Mariniflexile sp. AS56]|uniref:HAD family hydrolase n=1 Tax=Mariniflexile sp. AS56 TaxID=3063957 RepID=UPI0026EA229B|nr:HAD family hydrolase [Mariniflexile sp. AS56]MDO7170893.1 HAD family hydrolase [Mariniflexile sp. AS56]
MNFSNVKLVVTDMDGTLLNPKSEVSQRFFNQFKELKKRNIHFAAASGRQYQSILEKLYSIKDDISIIAENGGMMAHDNKEHILLKLTQENIQKSIEILREVEGAFIVLCGRKSAYIETNNQDFISKFSNYYSEYKMVDDLTKVTNDDFLKIAVYHFECSEKNILPHLGSLQSDTQIIVSGKNWLDISHANANKGYALNILQEKLGVTKEETMVFGDYNNDLQMLELAHFSYAMENAHADVKKIARYTTKSNAEEGVESIIEHLITT